MESNKPFVPSKLNQHFILYAKHHYKWSSDVIKDLSRFMLNWAGMPSDYKYFDREIYHLVENAFIDCCDKNTIKSLLAELFNLPIYSLKGVHRPTIRQAIRLMLTGLANLQIKEKNPETGEIDIILVELCEPNYEYLPKPDKRG